MSFNKIYDHGTIVYDFFFDKDPEVHCLALKFIYLRSETKNNISKARILHYTNFSPISLVYYLGSKLFTFQQQKIMN